jgi:mono/diheme cytochrome c family protein
MAQHIRWFVPALAAMVSLAGCGDDSATATPPTTSVSTVPGVPESAPRGWSFAQVSRGGELFARNCATCHGGNAEGAPNWRHRGPDGRFPPPPLNGTGHAWHHPKAVLHDVIKNGSPPGQGNMPAWRDRLTDEQIDDIIAWFQSQWPNQVYNAWYQMDQRSRQ